MRETQAPPGAFFYGLNRVIEPGTQTGKGVRRNGRQADGNDRRGNGDLQALKDQGVEHIFGYPGGAVLPIYDEIFQQDDIEHILVRHEQGAGHAWLKAMPAPPASPAWRWSPPVPARPIWSPRCTDALMDSIPLVCITGQVPTTLIGSDAFQECDTVGITRPCTKHNWLVKDVNDLSRVMHEAFRIATTGRPGPVVVDIPKDVQFATGTYTPRRR
jgi:acetolactate synthase-1/2/3 large subunit